MPQGRAGVACMTVGSGCAAFGRAFLRAAGTNPPPTQTNGVIGLPAKAMGHKRNLSQGRQVYSCRCHRLHRGVLHRQSAQVACDGVRAAKAIVRIFLEGLLTEEIHILKDLAAA